MPENVAVGAPGGGEDTIVVYVDIPQRAIDAAGGVPLGSEITLAQPGGGDIAFYADSLNALYDPIKNGDYYTTEISFTEFGGCDIDSAAVFWGDRKLGYAHFNVRSPDIDVHGPSYCVINVQDLALFAAGYPPQPYGLCSDYAVDFGVVDIVDLSLFALYYGDSCVSSGGPGPSAPQTTAPSSGAVRLVLIEENSLTGPHTMVGEVSVRDVEPYSALAISFVNQRSDLEFVAWEPDSEYPFLSAAVQVPRNGRNEIVIFVTGDESVHGDEIRIGSFVLNVLDEGPILLEEGDFELSFADLLDIGPPGGPQMVMSFDGLKYERVAELPRYKTELGQNYPNPFNPTTSISYSVGAVSQVQLAVYDVRGALVRTLVNEPKQPNVYRVTWDGRNSEGHRVASGVYFYRLTAGEFQTTRKMVLLK